MTSYRTLALLVAVALPFTIGYSLSGESGGAVDDPIDVGRAEPPKCAEDEELVSTFFTLGRDAVKAAPTRTFASELVNSLAVVGFERERIENADLRIAEADATLSALGVRTEDPEKVPLEPLMDETGGALRLEGDLGDMTVVVVASSGSWYVLSVEVCANALLAPES